MSVSDVQLRQEIENIVKKGNLDELSAKSVRLSLESKFGVDLSSRKEFVKTEIENVINGLEEPEEPKKKAAPKRKKASDSGDGEKKSTGGGGGGLMAPQKLSPELTEFTGQSTLPRTEVVKLISAYVKEHNLQNPENRREIICDAKLTALLGVDRTDYFKLQKHLSPHFLGRDENAPMPERKPRAPKAEKGAKGTKGAKKSKSDSEPADPKKRTAFTKPQRLSDALASLLGVEYLGRPQITKHVWKYIHAHNLQDPADKRTIVCDARLRQILGADTIGMMKLAGALNKHLSPIEDAGEQEKAWKVQEKFIDTHGGGSGGAAGAAGSPSAASTAAAPTADEAEDDAEDEDEDEDEEDEE